MWNDRYECSGFRHVKITENEENEKELYVNENKNDEDDILLDDNLLMD